MKVHGGYSDKRFLLADCMHTSTKRSISKTSRKMEHFYCSADAKTKFRKSFYVSENSYCNKSAKGSSLLYKVP